jgi:phage gp29-like protein
METIAQIITKEIVAIMIKANMDSVIETRTLPHCLTLNIKNIN